MDLAPFLASPETPIREVMATIDRNGKGIALVVDEQGRLLATVTDGDLRRAILANVDVACPVRALMKGTPPVTARIGTGDAQLVKIMSERELRHIPILDDGDRVTAIAFLVDLVKDYELPLEAVIMAGGYGTRLRPLTESVPKPMLPVGDRPLLELVVEQLRQAGIHTVNVTTHYKSDVISRHFGDGSAFGVDIRYVEESEPLGTAGALGLLEQLEHRAEPLLVMNGDILTRVNFRAMHDYHRDQKADMTVAVRQYELRVPYGVVESDGVVVTGISEKPLLRHFVSAGIYLLDPAVCRFVPSGQRCDMPDLIRRLVAENRRVVSFPVREYWVDIGQHEDYARANADVQSGKIDA